MRDPLIRVDLNCDLGESYGSWRMGADAAVMPFITSANIACGFHAGDPHVMRRTVDLAARHGVAVGAHPGFPDLVGFGRRPLLMDEDDVYDIVVHQIGTLLGHTRAAGLDVAHVKPHGALYNMAATDPAYADAIARAVRDVDPAMLLFGLSGSELVEAGSRIGLRTVSEVFADRAYQPDGTLAPRGSAGATLDDVDAAAARALRMLTTGRVLATDGTDIDVRAGTICIHGDHRGAVDLARALRRTLEQSGVRIAAPGSS